MGRRHGGGVAAERGRACALGAHRGARGGPVGRLAAARQAQGARAGPAGHARPRARAASCCRQALASHSVNIHRVHNLIHS